MTGGACLPLVFPATSKRVSSNNSVNDVQPSLVNSASLSRPSVRKRVKVLFSTGHDAAKLSARYNSMLNSALLRASRPC